MRFVVCILLVMVVSHHVAAQSSQPAIDRGRVIYNLDNSEFFVGKFGSIEPATIDKFVDEHAATGGITDLFINVNSQRTNYDSDVWESYWDGYDPEAGLDQPFFAGIDPKRRFESAFYINVRALHLAGCDYPKAMIDASRRNRIKPWISLRMNDSHYPDQPDHPFHSTFWRGQAEHRLHLEQLDYERPEVREHYLKLVREVCERYDIDGLELDYLRFWLYFRPGRETYGAGLMTAFVEQVRQLTEAAAKRLGHPVKLAVRVPTSPNVSRAHGLHAVTWAKAGLVDMVIAAPWWRSVNSDIPVEKWKKELAGADVTLAVSLEDGIYQRAYGRRTQTHDEMRGVLLSAWHRGADAVYFFNLFTGPLEYWPRKDHDRLLTDAGSVAALSAGPRRHVLTVVDPWAEGEPHPAELLPVTARSGAFQLHIGPKPSAGQSARVQLRLADEASRPAVAVNGKPCAFAGLVDPEHVVTAGCKPPEVGKRHAYTIPAGALRDGYNDVAFTADGDVTVNWVEIAISP